MPRPCPATPEELRDTSDRPVDVHAPKVPASVRQAMLARMQPGDQLWRCPRMSGRQGFFGLGANYPIIEWWLMDADGELIESFWKTV